MNLVWDLDLPLAPKMVLLSLADQANDHGVCWPAVSSMMKRTGMKERAVRENIRQLREVYGHLVIDPTSGKSNTYRVVVNQTPALNAWVHKMQGCTNRIPPRHQVQGTPALNAPPYIEPPLIHQGTTNARGGFDGFWSVYPKRKSKEQCRKAWEKLNPDEYLEQAIMAGLQVAMKSGQWRKKGEDGQVGAYIPSPLRFLQERQWEDDYGPVKLAPPSPKLAVVEPVEPITAASREAGKSAVREAIQAAKGVRNG